MMGILMFAAVFFVKTPVFAGDYVIDPNSVSLNLDYPSYSNYNSDSKWYWIFRSYLEQIEKDGGGTLAITAGPTGSFTYDISLPLGVGSNTTIVIGDGVTIRNLAEKNATGSNTAGTLFALVSNDAINGDSVYSGSMGESNITITGMGSATIDMNNYGTKENKKVSMGVVLAHNSNVVVSNLNFVNQGGGHFIEIDGSENVVISGCAFDGNTTTVIGNNDVNEAINIDTPDLHTGGFGYDFSSQDCEPNKNVSIIGCTFQNLQRAIGTHRYSNGMYHEYITISGCTFTNIVQTCIMASNWNHSDIVYNTFTNVGLGSKKADGTLARVYMVQVVGGTDDIVAYNNFGQTNDGYSPVQFSNATDGTVANGTPKYPDSLIAFTDGMEWAVKTNTCQQGMGRVALMYPQSRFIYAGGAGTPALVYGVKVVGTTANAVALTWTAAADASSYNVYYKPAGGSYQLAGNTAENSFVVGGLAEGTAYTFAVKAVAGGESILGHEVTAVTATSFTPADVTGLTVASQTADGVTFTWNPSEGADGYTVYLFDNLNISYIPLAQVAAPTYSVSGLAPYSTFKIKVSAYKLVNGVAVENANGAVIAASTAAPAMDVTVTQAVNMIKVGWSRQAGATGYEVWKKNAAGGYDFLARLNANESDSYTLDNLPASSVFTLMVRSYRQVNTTKVYSNPYEFEASTKASVQSGLKTAKRYPTSIQLSWNKQTGVTGYHIYRYDTGKKTWVLAKEVTKNTTTSATITKLKSATTYRFKICAYTTVGGKKVEGGFGQELTTNTTPAKTTGFAATAVSGGKVKLTWDKQGGATKYEVYKYNASKKEFELFKTVTTNNVTITMPADELYILKVRTIKVQDKNTFSGEMSEIYRVSKQGAKLASVTKKNANTITVKWSKLAKMQGYEIEYSTSSAFATGKGTIVSVDSATATSKDLAKLAKGTYYVRVRGYKDVNGQRQYSEWSASKTIKL